MEGWLEKKGEGGIFGWKKRYFRLLGKQLHYYKSPNDNSSVGFIPVEEIQTVHPTLHEKGKEGFHFQVNTSGKSYYLFTSSEDQFNYWLMGLVKLIKELGSDKKFFEPLPSPTPSLQDKDHRHIQSLIMNNPMVNSQRKQRSPTISPSSNAPIFPIQYPAKPVPKPNTSPLSSSDPPNLSSCITFNYYGDELKRDSQMNENMISEEESQKPPSSHINRPLPTPPSCTQSKEISTGSPNLQSRSMIASIKPLQPLPDLSINQPLTASEENKDNKDDPIDLSASSDSDDDDDNFDYYLDDFEDGDKELGDGNDQKQEQIEQNIVKKLDEINITTEEDQTEKVSIAMKRTSRYLNRINSSMKSNTSSFWEKSKIGSNPSQMTPRSEFLSLVRRRQSLGNNLADKRSRHRMRCAVEILETEENYVGNMELVVNHYMSSLNQSKDKRILTNLPIIFSNIETILPVNQQLLSLLRSRISTFLSSDHQPESNEELILGDIFTKMCPDLKLYSSYGTNYEMAITTYHRELKDKEFPLFKELIDRLDEETKNTQLHHLLIMPIQRIPRYNLLLSELIKYTDPTHSDYQNLITALENMKEVANHINNSVKVSRPDRKLELLQDRFDILNLLTPQRQLIKEGVVNVKNKKGKMGKRQILLCNDILVHVARSRVKRGNEFIKPENNWPISLLWPVDLSASSISPLSLPNQSSKEGKSEKEGGERASTIHNSNQQLKIIGPVLRPLIIDFDSVEEANEWKNALKKVIADHLSSLPPPPFPPFDPSHPKFSSVIAPSSGQFRYGEFTFPDQSHYTGYWLDGFKHGKGVYINGENKYEGYFIKNHLEGEGTLTMANGDEITGQFHLSSLSSLSLQVQIPSPSPHSKHPHSLPVTQPNNINNVNNNSISQSLEVFKTQKGDSFTGLWKANLKCDLGTMVYHNGDKYTGCWLNDLPHGKGTMYYKSKMRYNGEWLKGYRHGQGVMDYGNGSTYDGAWFNGKKHGFGTLVLPDGSYYEGEFSQNEYEGKGEMVYKNGRKYSGGWKAGKRSGIGCFSSAVGFVRVYEGEWNNDAFNGKGSITFDNNDKYEGFFKDFKMHGAGIYSLHNAKLNSKIILEGKWTNGIRDGKFIIKFENQTMLGYTRDNALFISGSQTELPLPSSPPFFDIDLS